MATRGWSAWRAAAAAGAWWAGRCPWWLGAVAGGAGACGGGGRWLLVRRRAPARRRAGPPHLGGVDAAARRARSPASSPCSTIRRRRSAPCRATARLGRAHVEVWARRGAAGQLRPRLAGERVGLTGRVEPIAPSGAAERLAERHVRGQVVVEAVTGWSPGDPASRAANHVRRTLERGRRVLPPRRACPLPRLRDRRRPRPVRRPCARPSATSGLAHLSAVSGQNVAFLLRRGRSAAAAAAGSRGRWVGDARRDRLVRAAHPVRAVGAAGLGHGGAGRHLGVPGPAGLERPAAGPGRHRPAAGRSAAGAGRSGGGCRSAPPRASCVLAGPLGRPLPGPTAAGAGRRASRWPPSSGVAPVQLAVFGPLPVASVPANLLAGPVAGPVMVWGLPAGLVAGLVPEPVAAACSTCPTLLGVRWIALVARLGQAAPLGS